MFSFTQPLSRGHAATRGLLAAVLGGVFLVWPGITIGTVIALFAISSFSYAVTSTVRLFAPGQSAGDRALLGVRAVVELGAGVVALAYPAATAAVMTVVIGLYAISVGVLELVEAYRAAQRDSGGTGWLVVGGTLSILAGSLLVAWPGVGTVTLAILFGAYLLGYGVTLLVSATVTPRGATVADPLARA